MNCTTCFWWSTQWGCNNTNWITGKLTDPADTVCGGLSYRVIPIKAQ